MTRWAVLLTSSVLFTSSSTVFAQSSAPQDDSASGAPPASIAPAAASPIATDNAEQTTSQSRSRWYGWETLLVDGAVMTIGMLPLLEKDEPRRTALGIGWYGAYALGTPIVHWSRGHVGKGFGSLGMRVGGPLAGGLVGAGLAWLSGAKFGSSDSPSDGDLIVQGGVVLGMIAPIVIDAVFLAREEVPVRDRVARPAVRNAGVQVSGGPVLLRGGGGLSLVGTF
jgi:hypothetical protein